MIEEHRAAKMLVAFEVMRGIPVEVTITKGRGNEKHELRGMLEPGRLYAVDRGYAENRAESYWAERGKFGNRAGWPETANGCQARTSAVNLSLGGLSGVNSRPP